MSETIVILIFVVFVVALGGCQETSITVEQSHQIWLEYHQRFPNYCIVNRKNFDCGEHDFQRNATFYMGAQPVEVQILR
jgi:hypothetical protein